MRFDHLSKALIDASSIIYSNRAGFLDILASEIKLQSVSDILAEAGSASNQIDPLFYQDSSLSNDQKLISCALNLALPVISEDKKILQALKRTRKPYYNSLMMLNFLLYRKRIEIQEYDQYRQALQKFARYSDEVWNYGAKLQLVIKELI
jgi:hypothetical protein